MGDVIANNDDLMISTQKTIYKNSLKSTARAMKGLPTCTRFKSTLGDFTVPMGHQEDRTAHQSSK